MQQEKLSDSDLLELMVIANEATPVDFCKYHHIKNEAGLELEFIDRKYLIDFLNDMSPLQVLLKAPQIGASLAEIIKTFWCAKKKGWDIIYTLPTQGDVNDMAGSKVNRVIAQNPIFMKWVKEHDTVEQKSIGSSIIHYRGTFTTKQAMMVSSDLNVHDEVDASSQEVIQQYETRLQAKANGRRWYFSHPQLNSAGIDRYWQQSDKKEWFIICDKCSKEQQLKWPENISMEKRSYICSSCLESISNETRKNGYWKKTSVGIFSGYHISQLMCPWISAAKIVNDWETKDKQYFFNFVLGLPYIGGDNRIEPAVVLRNCTDAINDQTDRIMIGADLQQKCIKYCIGNKQGAFYYGKTKDVSATYDPYDDLEKFLKRWPLSFIIADQGGDLMGIRKLQAKYPARVFLCTYVRDNFSDPLYIHWGEKEKFGTVNVQRNRMITIVAEQLKDIGRLRLNGTRDEWLEFASEFGNIYRELVVQPDTPGKDQGTLYKTQYIWKRNGPDDYVHAFVYMLTGLDKYGTQAGTVVTPDIFGEMPIGRIDFSGRDALSRVVDNSQEFGF